MGMTDDDLNILSLIAQAESKPVPSHHLYPGLSPDDFATPSTTNTGPDAFSSKQRTLQARDGFSRMESAEVAKISSVKRRRRERTIPGMGQLTCVEGCKESHKRAKGCRQMPIIDPDLLARQMPSNNEASHIDEELSKSDQGHHVDFTRAGSISRELHESQSPDILPSVEYPESESGCRTSTSHQGPQQLTLLGEFGGDPDHDRAARHIHLDDERVDSSRLLTWQVGGAHKSPSRTDQETSERRSGSLGERDDDLFGEPSQNIKSSTPCKPDDGRLWG